MDVLLSPKQIARAIGAGESSVKRWCDDGVLRAARTAGGHRRIPLADVLRLVRDQGLSIVEPELLALPPAIDRKSRRGDDAPLRLAHALLQGDEQAARAIVFDLYLAGAKISLLCDDVIAAAFRIIGDRWQCRQADVYQERAACQIMLGVLHELRSQQHVAVGRPALGATLSGDHYTLPALMAEVVLRSRGRRAEFLGPSIPAESLVRAIRRRRPGLFWLSVSHIQDERAFRSGVLQIAAAARAVKAAFVIGGRAATEELRASLPDATFCDSMWQFEQLACAAPRRTRPRRTSHGAGAGRRGASKS